MISTIYSIPTVTEVLTKKFQTIFLFSDQLAQNLLYEIKENITLCSYVVFIQGFAVVSWTLYLKVMFLDGV